MYITGEMTITCKPKNNTKFEIGQTVMVKNQAHHTFKPQYLMDYRVLKILNESTLLLVVCSDKEHKMNINDVKLCTTLELVENAWNSFLNFVETKCKNHD